MNWYLKVLKQYADFNGRARRKEFWMFSLFNFLIAFVLMLAMIALTLTLKPALIIVGYIIYVCYLLAIFIPGLAVAVRRLHDIGKSGWYYLIGCIPLVGGIILLVWFCQDSQPGANEYGSNPKEGQSGENGRGGGKPPVNNNCYARLSCRVGNNAYTYNINTPRTTIGRATNNDLILNHTTVSGHHAEIVFTGNYFEVIDLGSTNKVIVNGQFFQRTMLRNGDMIGLGEVVITFYV